MYNISHIDTDESVIRHDTPVPVVSFQSVNSFSHYLTSVLK